MGVDASRILQAGNGPTGCVRVFRVNEVKRAVSVQIYAMFAFLYFPFVVFPRLMF